jgi:hypothetical protein
MSIGFIGEVKSIDDHEVKALTNFEINVRIFEEKNSEIIFYYAFN